MPGRRANKQRTELIRQLSLSGVRVFDRCTQPLVSCSSLGSRHQERLTARRPKAIGSTCEVAFD
jgi:hypothetical protein